MFFRRCFSLNENSRFIWNTKINKKSIAPIHGIRALGALWIFAGHVYYYAFGPTDNLQLIFAYANSWSLQPIFAAAINVDSFFVSSSTLCCFLLFFIVKIWNFSLCPFTGDEVNCLIALKRLLTNAENFLPSGFLLSYMFYEKQKKRPSKQLVIDVIKGVVYRYIRIAPCFMIVR